MRGLTPMGVCRNCGSKYDPESFRVRVQGQEFLSYLCPDCTRKDGAEMIQSSTGPPHDQGLGEEVTEK